MMIIKGKLNTYKVICEESGWSYAVPLVYEKRKLPFLPIYRWVNVWEGKDECLVDAERMLPSEMIEWFNNTVSEYENYKTAWEEYCG